VHDDAVDEEAIPPPQRRGAGAGDVGDAARRRRRLAIEVEAARPRGEPAAPGRSDRDVEARGARKRRCVTGAVGAPMPPASNA
jgi:hypothetical protein